MNILAFDCSSKTMAAAIGSGETVLAAAFSDENRNHAPYLMPMIHRLLEETGLKMRDIDLLGVTVGPGSFTGLRIGIATAKGFADLLGIPVAPLCSIDVLAENYREHRGILVPVLDARKNQVYAAVYDNREGKMEKILRETPISPLEELAAKLPAGTKPLFFGDAVPGWKERLEAFYGENILFGAEDCGGIRGEALHRLTAAAPASAYTADPMPVYLRGVDAKARFADYTIDAMREKDIPELVALDKTAFPRPWTEKMFLGELHSGYGHYWVIRSEGKVTAYGGFWLVARECHITNIAVHADHRHTGQGRAMLEHIIKAAKLYGAHGVTLEVRPSNETALHLYESHGFVREGTRKKYYEDNGEDAIIMWLRFPDFSQEKPWR
ncbi:MAG: tRNA (adenosine(37)-N6)-threonylcarbamoyltransferase complex dimerization subunit type 1 TsaB [Bacillota bacterium]|jgi:tRNA threonylcarbamoyl adenosine modification protein YeaZ/ribosomal-protein-alanine acetyltransferase